MRMGACIQAILHIDPDALNDDEFAKAWGRTRFYMETIMNVTFQ
jgi:hypothetical protein